MKTCVGRITYNFLPLCVCFFTYIISRHNGMLYPMLIARNRKNWFKNFYIEFWVLELTCVLGIKHACKAGKEAIGKNVKSTHMYLSIGSREYLLCGTDLGSYVGWRCFLPYCWVIGGKKEMGSSLTWVVIFGSQDPMLVSAWHQECVEIVSTPGISQDTK